MPDLADGDSVEIQGSAAKPYLLKNTGGVYSCSCPAWRNQSIAIEQRTCKHLRKYRGDAAETERIGSALPQKPVRTTASSSDGDDEAAGTEPPILLAESWDNSLDLAGWWMSEKLDGVRAYWDGTQFLSRQGNVYHAPDWFLDGLPSVPLDGELWLDRKAFQRTVSIVRRQDKNEQWKSIRYLVFDAPALSTSFEERMEFLNENVRDWTNGFVTVHPHELCRDVAHLREELQRIESLGGEGLMLRQPGSTYVAGRSSTLLKVKTFHDSEATVIRHETGRGRHSGRLGALAVRLPDGTEFAVGTGFSDRERENPPPVGSLIQFRYQELSDGGVPRFPSYVGVRTDVGVPHVTRSVSEGERSKTSPTPATTKPAFSGPIPSVVERSSSLTHRVSQADEPSAPTSSPRYFEFVDGSSSKFWEIALSGSDVTTRWGRIGTDGQSKTKSFGSSDKARTEYEKLVSEKTGKGYVEVGGVTATSEPAHETPQETSTAVAEVTELALNAVEATDTDSAPRGGIAELKRLLAALPDGPQKSRMQQRLAELVDLFAEPEPEPEPAVASGIPSVIHLQPTEELPFANVEAAARLSKAIVRAGFTLVGDFTIRELPVRLRAFLRGSDTFAVINELGQHQWVELCVINADATYENWSNVPAHDGRTPPWTTFVRDPSADFNQLHALMLAGRSDKEPAALTAANFSSFFERAYARSFQWRESAQREEQKASAHAAKQSSGSDALQFADSGTRSGITVFTASLSPLLRKPSSTSSTDLANPVTPVSPKIEQMVLVFAEEYYRDVRKRLQYQPPDFVPMGKTILKLSPSEQLEVVRASFQLRLEFEQKYREDITEDLRHRLLKRRLPLTDDDLRLLASELCRELNKVILGAIKDWTRTNSLPLGAANLLRQARDNGHRNWYDNEVETLKARIDTLVGDDAVRVPIQPSEVWSVAAMQDIEQMPAEQRGKWTQLLQCCVAATTAKPTDKWLKVATPLIEALTRDEFLKYANKWMPLVEKPWPNLLASLLGHVLQILDGNQVILRGLVWFCSLAEDRDTTRTLGNLARTCFRTVPNSGPRSAKVGNAVVFTLGAMSIPDAVTQLAILKVKVKNGHAQNFIDGELQKAAERLGIPREELEEMSVPAYGLEEVGRRREELGDFAAELIVEPCGETELRWFKADGSPQKSVPAAVQKDFADDVKELKTAAKDIQKMVVVQRERIDSLFLQQKQWPLVPWRERYLDHPLVGIIARRLIWVFRTGSTVVEGIFHDGQIVGLDDAPVGGFDDSTTVELWHPIGRSIDDVVACREWLDRHAVQQPFKQAHREVYVPTDAERSDSTSSGSRKTSEDVAGEAGIESESVGILANSATSDPWYCPPGYSTNRFAAHVLKQFPLRTLASARGWQARLLGRWDGGGETEILRFLPRWNLTASFWINAIYHDEEEADIDSPGVLYVSTDRICFHRGEATEYSGTTNLIRLADVPPLVFSEILRDVDLFVGIASVGNDPHWQASGPSGHYPDYWTRFSFGDLSQTAKTRRDVLQRLIPRLTIANRCSFEDRFMVVRGDLRTYRIHLGSGNVQMEPTNQFLCIDPKTTDTSEITGQLVPFEGDRILSIILSKTHMLAEDKKIKDPTIVSQIRSV